MLGTGQQHWATVHVADIADFFRRVLEHGTVRGTTSSAMDSTRPSPNSPRRPPSQPELQERSPAPTRLGTGSVTTSPKSCHSIKAPSPLRPGPSSIGLRPTQDSSRNYATEATASNERIRRPAVGGHARAWSLAGRCRTAVTALTAGCGSSPRRRSRSAASRPPAGTPWTHGRPPPPRSARSHARP
jgi:hypothetical protein